MLLIRGEDDRVRPMLAGTARRFAKELDVAEAASPLRVIQFEQTKHGLPGRILAIAIDIERVADFEHAHGLTDGQLKRLLLGDLAICDRHPRYGLTALSTEQDATLAVLGGGYPGAVFGPVGL